MNAPGKKLKSKRKKLRRGPSMSFGELVRKLWQPESEELEPEVKPGKLRKQAAKGKRIRKS
jgi:hypothetical protein